MLSSDKDDYLLRCTGTSMLGINISEIAGLFFVNSRIRY